MRQLAARSIERLRSLSLVKDGAWLLFVGMTIMSLGNLGFQLVVTRLLVPSEYGGLSALLGLLAVFGVPAAALQVVITREVVAKRPKDSDEPLPLVIGPLLAEAVLWGLLAAGALLVIAPSVRSFLHLSELMPAILMAVFAVPIAIDLVPKAVLLGELRFKRLGVGLAAGSMVKLVMAYVLTRRAGVTGAMQATIIGELVTAAILLPALRGFVRHVEGVEPVWIRWRESLGAVFAFTGFWVLTGIDTLLARHYLPRVESGYYAAGSTAAQVALFIPGAISVVAFPRFAQGGGAGRRARVAFMEALFLVAMLGFALAAVVSIGPGFVVGRLFGSQYLPSSSIAGFLAFAASLVGLVGVLMHFHLAGRSRFAALPWLGVAIVSVVVFFHHGSTTAIAVTALVAGTVVFVAMLIPAVVRRDPAPVTEMAKGALWELAEPTLDLTIVVPFYNPGPLLLSNMERLVAVLRAASVTFEIIAVSDGSTDGSELLLAEYEPEVVTCVVLPRNAGKGQALRVGLADGRGRYLGFIDADGDLDPGLLDPFINIVRMYEPDVILGSKRHPMSDVEYPPLRRVYSWGYQQLVWILFRLHVRDTQTGLKLIKREVLATTLPRMVEKRFAFDLELLVVARHLGYRKFFEAPVKIQHQFTSTISWRSVRGMMLDTMAIFYRLRLLHHYDSAGPSATTPIVSPVVLWPENSTPS